LKVTAVSYLNTKPFLYGLFKSGFDRCIELRLDIPSECARRMVAGEADLGLIPVAAIPALSTPHIISDYCIGSTGRVATVCIFSDCPLEEVEAVYLDFHSRTSVELTKILLRHFWKMEPRLLPGAPGFENNIAGKTAALIIGDRAIGLEKKYPFVYDLGEAWTTWTGLPFVFAAWVSNRPLPADFVANFNAALKTGLDFLPQLIHLLPALEPGFSLEKYFTENISYPLDFAKREGLQLFLAKLPDVPKTFSLTFV
jgi:chorismate dehydratase